MIKAAAQEDSPAVCIDQGHELDPFLYLKEQ